MTSSIAPAAHKDHHARPSPATAYSARARNRAALSARVLEQASMRQAASPAHAYFACPIHFEASPTGRAKLATLDRLLTVYSATRRLFRR